jgi:cytochrome c oxidase cbb3-type subunit I/II
MYDPQSTSSGSIMPAYQWLVRNELDKSQTEAKMETLAKLGVPYSEDDIANAQQLMLEQGTKIEKNLYADPDFAETYEADKQAGGQEFVEIRNREIVAMIAYLQRLGNDIKVKDLESKEN